MPAGYSIRVYKKKYRTALEGIADKIPAAVSGKKDKNRWISEVTNLRLQDMKRRESEDEVVDRL